MTTPCPHCGTPPRPVEDGRAIKWRVRFRLYRDGSDEPIADSDPERPPDAAGAMACHGLPAVADELRGLAQTFHGQACVGLDAATLRHSLRSLRPTIQRRGGNGVWRVAYKTLADDGTERLFMARVDVEKL